MNTVTELVNINTNYLERVLDKGTIKNVTNFGAVYKSIIKDNNKNDVYTADLSSAFHILVTLVLNEDLPALYIGEYIAKLAKEKESTAGIELRKLDKIQKYYATNLTVSSVLDKIILDYGAIYTFLNKIPPKNICLYQQYNICCYTKEYISKYSIEGKLGYGDLANINEEVAEIYNFVFEPNTKKTKDDKLGEYYLRINDATPELFLDPKNNLFIISSVINYAYNPTLYNLFSDLANSDLLPVGQNITLDDKKNWWNDLSKKYRIFFKLLRENTLSY